MTTSNHPGFTWNDRQHSLSKAKCFRIPNRSCVHRMLPAHGLTSTVTSTCKLKPTEPNVIGNITHRRRNQSMLGNSTEPVESAKSTCVSRPHSRYQFHVPGCMALARTSFPRTDTESAKHSMNTRRIKEERSYNVSSCGSFRLPRTLHCGTRVRTIDVG